jgi:hypothetical protein
MSKTVHATLTKKWYLSIYLPLEARVPSPNILMETRRSTISPADVAINSGNVGAFAAEVEIETERKGIPIGVWSLSEDLENKSVIYGFLDRESALRLRIYPVPSGTGKWSAKLETCDLVSKPKNVLTEYVRIRQKT